MTTAVLALKIGFKSREDRARMIELCNGGGSWRNATGSVHGEPVGDNGIRLPRGSQLPAEWVAQLNYDTHTDGVDYVVWSYDTPIAWHVPARSGRAGHWVKPSVRYSATTNNHQGILYGLADEVISTHTHPLYI